MSLASCFDLAVYSLICVQGEQLQCGANGQCAEVGRISVRFCSRKEQLSSVFSTQLIP